MSSRSFQTLVSRGHICFPEPSRSKVSMFKNCQDPILAFQTLAFPNKSFPDPIYAFWISGFTPKSFPDTRGAFQSFPDPIFFMQNLVFAF